MKKIVILLLLILVISAICFIHLTQQKTITIKGPFLKVYSQLVNADDWEKWRPDLRKIRLTDSNKIFVQKSSNSFLISHADLKLNVKLAGNSVNITEQNNSKINNYTYTLLPGKLLDKTIITVEKKTNIINYLIGKIKPASFSDTYIGDFKNFMETDSLYYGCRIFKTRVPGSNLIVITKAVLTKNKFAEASKMLYSLQQYVKTNNIKQIQPLIAQFTPIDKDSTQDKVGFFIDKEVKSVGDIYFVRMPKNGPIYASKFYGEFYKRRKIYTGLKQYFSDHLYELAILPFETYLDNKLPVSDTDKIKIQVNFCTFF
jgi:effector-binding domain-containing protein